MSKGAGKSYDAVILAGGRAPWLREAQGTDIRCLAKIKNKRILDYLVDALRESCRVNRIMVAGPVAELSKEELPAGVELCDAAGDMPSTAVHAAKVLGTTGKIFYVCDDIPLLHGAAIRDFLDQCEAAPQGQAYYPIIPKEVCLSDYPAAKRTYAKLADGTFTGGNMMIVDTEIMDLGLAKAREIFALRKNVWKLCRWLGFGFIFRLLIHSLTVADVERRTTELLELNSKAIISKYAEVGMDVDKMADLELVEKYL